MERLGGTWVWLVGPLAVALFKVNNRVDKIQLLLVDILLLHVPTREVRAEERETMGST